MNDQHDPGLDVRGMATGVIAIVVMIALAVTAAWLAWSGWRPQGARNGPNAPADFGVAGARLESAPKGEREAYFDDKQRLLHAWSWVDRRAGIARIPIEEAMMLLARQHGQRRQTPEERSQ